MTIPNTGYEGTQFSYTAGSVISIYSLESIWDYLVKVKLCLFYDNVTSFLAIHLWETHTCVYATMLIAQWCPTPELVSWQCRWIIH